MHAPAPWHDHLLPALPGSDYSPAMRVVVLRYTVSYAASIDFEPVTSAAELDAAKQSGKLAVIHPAARTPTNASRTTSWYVPSSIADNLRHRSGLRCRDRRTRNEDARLTVHRGEWRTPWLTRREPSLLPGGARHVSLERSCPCRSRAVASPSRWPQGNGGPDV